MKWSQILPVETMELGKQLANRALEERRTSTAAIFPPQERIFHALKLTPPDKVKVCIVGQDPYHTPGAANGLAFSTSRDVPIQPSLRNIFKELRTDMGYDSDPVHGDLTAWAENGVLLLNTTLKYYNR